MRVVNRAGIGAYLRGHTRFTSDRTKEELMTEILAEVSSRGRRKGRPRDGDDIRWVDLIISRENDLYTAEVVRCSDVYHTSPTECEAYEAHRVQIAARELDETDRPCYRCKPLSRGELSPDDIVIAEDDRDETRKTRDAEALIVACLEMTGDGRTMTDLAKRALLVAGKNDLDIRYAYDQAMDQTHEVAS